MTGQRRQLMSWLLALAAVGLTRPQQALGDLELQISEIDYAQPGEDDAEWIEIRNPQDAEYMMDGVELVFYDTIDGVCTEYRRVDLGSIGMLDASEVVVIGAATCGRMSLGATVDAIHDSPGCVVAIERGSVVLDSIEYGSTMLGNSCAIHRTSAVDIGAGVLRRCVNGWSFTTQSTACTQNDCE